MNWGYDKAIDAYMGAGCMRGLKNPFPAPGVDNVIQPRTSLAPPQGGGTLKKVVTNKNYTELIVNIFRKINYH